MTTRGFTGIGRFLSTIPSLLGRSPRGSLVVCGMADERLMVSMARMNLADCARGGAEACAEYIAESLRAKGAVAVLLVAYPQGEDAAAREVTAELCAVAGEAFDRVLPVWDAWVVARGRYRSIQCRDAACCPPEGMALPVPDGFPTPTASEVAAACADVWHLEHDEADADTSPARSGNDAGRRQVLAARRRALAEWKDTPREDRATAMMAAWYTAVEAAVDGHLPTDAQAGRLMAAISDVRVRDAILVWVWGGSEEAVAELCRGGEPAEVAGMVNDVMWGEPPIDRTRVDATATLCRDLAGRLWSQRPLAEVAELLTVEAVCARWLGRRTRSWDALKEALDVDPTHGLSYLISRAWTVPRSLMMP